MSKRSVSYLLADMLDAIQATSEFTEDIDYQSFLADRKTRDAVVRNVQILGEAANRVPAIYRDQHPDVEWIKIIRSRHILVHDYFGVDYEIIWQIITVHLPILKPILERLIVNELTDLSNDPLPTTN
jgi:uncharacterized protein with HEPN domain